MELDAGTEIELDATLERLVVLGYERVDRVSRPGEFAVRGGIVDVFPSTRRSPVRVEWWGDEIESVDRKSTRLNSSHANISYAVFCLKKKKSLCRVEIGERIDPCTSLLMS